MFIILTWIIYGLLWIEIVALFFLLKRQYAEIKQLKGSNRIAAIEERLEKIVKYFVMLIISIWMILAFHLYVVDHL